MSHHPIAVKDDEASHPIAGKWRPLLCEVVAAFVDGDFELSRGVSGVDAVPAETAEHIRDYIAEYGETLVELPEETWQTSCAQWMDGYWDVIVDLWTAGEGPSDLILNGKMVETDGLPHFTVGLVYVP